MTPRTFGYFLMTWLYLSLAGAAIILFHTGPYDRFWMLMLSAAVSWFSLRRLAAAESRN